MSGRLGITIPWQTLWRISGGAAAGPRPEGQRTEQDWLDSTGKRFESMVNDGKLKSAMRMVTDRNSGKLYRPDDSDSKTGAPVIDVLRGKHPEARVPSAENFNQYEHEPDSVGILIYEEDVAREAGKIDGAPGPDGLDALTLRFWLCNWTTRSEKLHEEMAEWASLLSNGSPDYAMYRAVNSARMLAKDKQPGVRPLACGVIYMRLWARCNLAAEVKDMACDACGIKNSCAGLQSGIEGNVHAVRAIWPESAGWEFDRGTSEQPTDMFQHLLNGAESHLRAQDVMGEPGRQRSSYAQKDAHTNMSVDVRMALRNARVNWHHTDIRYAERLSTSCD